MTDARGRYCQRWREGEAAHAANLDGYACYAAAQLELYAVTYDAGYLLDAMAVSEKMLDYFGDTSGGFFLYAHDSEQLIGRPKEVYDTAMPSGNSVAGHVLCRLAQLTGAKKWEEARDLQLRFLAGAVKDMPATSSAALDALSAVLYPSGEIICAAGGDSAPDTLKAFLKKHDIVNLSVVVKNDRNNALLEKAIPEMKHYPIPSGLPVYYFCRAGACHAPTENLGDILRFL
jgi:uncharacterized protein YyaL (SSP411 family)